MNVVSKPLQLKGYTFDQRNSCGPHLYINNNKFQFYVSGSVFIINAQWSIKELQKYFIVFKILKPASEFISQNLQCFTVFLHYSELHTE